MAISGNDRAQITARAGVARASTARTGAVGNSNNMYTATTSHHRAGEFMLTEATPPTTTYTNVARSGT